MSEKKGIEVSKKLVKSLDDLVEVGEEILADGKVDFNDVMQLPKFAPILEGLYDVWKQKEELVAEAKDLDWAEAAALLGVASE